ncbi:MAG TPA: transglycosylase domain-containing protein [Myxococcota bacterium]|nr:transglycosylase domain-containing protein [Myxococcota bacterium]
MLAAALLTPLVLYLRFVPDAAESAIPAEPTAFPVAALDLAARLSGCEARPRFEARNVYTLWFHISECEVNVASVASKQLSLPTHRRGHLRWAATQISGTIWLTRHWTADQALATTLSIGYFGRGMTGLSAAAGTYFGLPPENLAREELAQLVALLRSSSSLDPCCQPDRNREQANRLLGGRPAQRIESRTLPAPAGACARSQ